MKWYKGHSTVIRYSG